MPVRTSSSPCLLLAAWLFGAASFAAQTGARPQPAVMAVLAAFGAYDVVGMNAGHGNEKQDEFILSLLRHPSFPATVNDIVVECGSSRFQAIVDRFVAGEDMSSEEARRPWRETSLSMCALSAFYEALA